MSASFSGEAEMRVRAAVIAVLLAASLTGCSDNPVETSEEPAEGVSGHVGKVQVRNLFVLGGRDGAQIPVGGSAPVYFTLVNSPETVESAGASGKAGNAAGADMLVGVSSPSAASSTILQGPVKAPVGQDVVIGPQARVVLSHVAKPLVSGENVTVTLTFKHAGSGTFTVPIQAQQEYLATYSPAPSG
ncbi:hypothetical protein GCM10022254_46160 [Actinomadura meridiana]|uniref:Copper(I)-binding protein n=1 Tax=Actinomadura meridiana TaxID=559626 RepID=A0ABP8CAG7_9ACTN